jgi:virulence-associated protein VagC
MGLLSQNQSQYYNSSNSANYGDYQFTSLENIINAFMFAYVGEDKIIGKVNRTDVQFHAMRAIQELSYDVLRSFKSQEIEVPNTLSMILPQDYVNYVKLVRIGKDGIERILYPARKTSDPFAITQDADGNYDFSTGAKRKITIDFTSGVVPDDRGVKLGLVSGGIQTDAYFIVQDNTADSSPLNTQIGTDLTEVNNSVAQVVLMTVSSLTTTSQAAAFAEAINNFAGGNFYTATSEGPLLTVEYKFDNISTPTSEGILATNGSVAVAPTVINAGSAAGDSLIEQTPSDTFSSFKSQTPIDYHHYDINNATDVEISREGRRYGLDPQYSQINGSFFIDNLRGLIKFGSDLAGETITLHYVSDGLGTDAEMVVHKFCEEAVYKHIAYGILSTKSNIPPFIVQRFKRERFAETRKAKIRLSNIKIEEFTQVLKGMGKQIK